MKKEHLFIGAGITVSLLALYYFVVLKEEDDDYYDEDDFEFADCRDLTAISCGTDGSINFIEEGGDLTDYITVNQTCCEGLGYEWGISGGGKAKCLCPEAGINN
tara:strand:+ start:106 stop:417 length:312 start_codon:yes stop_codon:yes gene_type:complete